MSSWLFCPSVPAGRGKRAGSQEVFALPEGMALTCRRLPEGPTPSEALPEGPIPSEALIEGLIPFNNLPEGQVKDAGTLSRMSLNAHKITTIGIL